MMRHRCIHVFQVSGGKRLCRHRPGAFRGHCVRGCAAGNGSYDTRSRKPPTSTVRPYAKRYRAQPMNQTDPILRIDALRGAMASELDNRRCGGDDFSYAGQRGGEETLYGLTGAVNIMAALGLHLGDRARRCEMAEGILRYQNADGTFRGPVGPGHALHMVVAALSLLGQPIPANIAPLAPSDSVALSAWLECHDWGSTHKELCGQTIPLLASGTVGPEWVATFLQAVEARLDPNRPLDTWCAADAPPWRVISSIYHVLSAFDAGRIPYPQPELLIQRLLGLRWNEVDNDVQRTVCTDGDWALLLLNLCNVLPAAFPAVMTAVRAVSARRVRHWHVNRETIMAADTHHLYCYLWVTAVFQSVVRDHYAGGVVIDTLNDPALFRL